MLLRNLRKLLLLLLDLPLAIEQRTLQAHGLDQGLAHARRDLAASTIGLQLAEIGREDRDCFAMHPLFLYGQRAGLPGWNRIPEAIQGIGSLHRFRRLHQLPFRLEGVLDDHILRFLRQVFHEVVLHHDLLAGEL